MSLRINFNIKINKFQAQNLDELNQQSKVSWSETRSIRSIQTTICSQTLFSLNHYTHNKSNCHLLGIKSIQIMIHNRLKRLSSYWKIKIIKIETPMNMQTWFKRHNTCSNHRASLKIHAKERVDREWIHIIRMRSISTKKKMDNLILIYLLQSTRDFSIYNTTMISPSHQINNVNNIKCPNKRLHSHQHKTWCDRFRAYSSLKIRNHYQTNKLCGVWDSKKRLNQLLSR